MSKFSFKSVGNKTKKVVTSAISGSIVESVLDGNWLSWNAERPYIKLDITEDEIIEELTSRNDQ